jgi:hypothetical protein
MGQDYDDGVFIPSTTYMTKIQGGLKKYLQGTIMASARSADATSKAQRQITALLRERHNLPKGHRRRLLDPQPGRDGQRAAGGDQDADHAAGQHRGRVAAGRAASAS